MKKSFIRFIASIFVLIALVLISGLCVLFYLEWDDTRAARKLVNQLNSLNHVESYYIERQFEDNLWAKVWFKDGYYLDAPGVSKFYITQDKIVIQQIGSNKFSCEKASPSLSDIYRTIFDIKGSSTEVILKDIRNLTTAVDTIFEKESSVIIQGTDIHGEEYTNNCTIHMVTIPQRPKENQIIIDRRG
ncbi:hypothetical protein [Hellea balneolensis]|uniref:hypothetical protein n=1 Tax=Hellea balneolensis TaxID=287478 RepID=UPI00047B7AC8|nr:hypothetical protein [Hellea balneolensis]